MADDRTLKKVFLGKSHRRRKEGRPKLRWPNSIENDMKLMGAQEMEEEGRRQICMGYQSEGAVVNLHGPCAEEHCFPFVYLFLTC
jgi:hypothetical protein